MSARSVFTAAALFGATLSSIATSEPTQDVGGDEGYYEDVAVSTDSLSLTGENDISVYIGADQAIDAGMLDNDISIMLDVTLGDSPVQLTLFDADGTQVYNTLVTVDGPQNFVLSNQYWCQFFDENTDRCLTGVSFYVSNEGTTPVQIEATYEFLAQIDDAYTGDVYVWSQQN